jgi:glyoxylase-like metal-dependent hydrolase (beta-lactamase superfamily II)
MPRLPHYEDAGVRIEKLVVGPFENNVFVLRCKSSGEAAIVDAANEHDLLLDVSRATGVRRVLTTHGHWDHIQAVEAVRDAGIDVGIAPEDASMLPAYDFTIPDDDVIQVGDLRLHTIHTPGHTQGSTCFLLEGRPVLFSGDTPVPGTRACRAATSTRSSSRSTGACSPCRVISSCCPATVSTRHSTRSARTSRNGSTAGGEGIAGRWYR